MIIVFNATSNTISVISWQHYFSYIVATLFQLYRGNTISVISWQHYFSYIVATLFQLYRGGYE